MDENYEATKKLRQARMLIEVAHALISDVCDDLEDYHTDTGLYGFAQDMYRITTYDILNAFDDKEIFIIGVPGWE